MSTNEPPKILGLDRTLPERPPTLLERIEQREERRRRDQFNLNMAQAIRQDPNLVAEARRLGAEIDPSRRPRLSEITANIDVYRKAHAKVQADYDEMSKRLPYLRDAMLRPDFAAIAHDDVEALGFFEGFWNDIKRGYAQNELGKMGARAAAFGLSDELFDEIESQRDYIESLGTSGWTGFAMAGEILGQMAEGADEALLGAAAGAAVGTVVPGAGTVGGAIVGGNLAMSANSATAAAGLSYLEMVDRGISIREARSKALQVGLWTAALEYVGGKGSAKAIGAMGRFARASRVRGWSGAEFAQMAREVGIDFTMETATEVTQEAAQMLLEHAAVRADRELAWMERGVDGRLRGPDGLPVTSRIEDGEFWSTMGQTAYEIGSGMLVLGIGGTTISGAARRAFERRQARDTTNLVNAIGKAAKESKSLEREPELVQAWVREITRDGPVSELHLNIDDARAVLEELDGDDAALDEIFNARQQIELKQQNPDLEVEITLDIADLMKLAKERPQVFQKIKKHLRAPAQERTLAQMEEDEKTARENMAKWRDAYKAMEQGDEAKPQREPPSPETLELRRIRQDARRALQNAGMAPGEANDNATLIVQSMIANAVIVDESPEQFYLANKATVIRGVQDARRRRDEMRQDDFGQEGGYEFDEASFSPEMVSWARDQFGDRVAPNGMPVWQNAVRALEGTTVVDEQGQPMVVHHFGTFDERADIPRTGMHFGTKAAAEERGADWKAARESAQRAGGSRNVRPFQTTQAYLSLRNPLRVSDLASDDEASLLAYLIEHPELGVDIGIARRQGSFTAVQQAGYDGLVYENVVEDAGNDSYVVFSPEQVKSVNNYGNFDTGDGRILYQTPGSIPQWARQEAPGEIDKKASISISPKPERAAENLERLDAIFEQVPNPLASEEAWLEFQRLLVADNNVLGVPANALRYAMDPQAVADYLSRLRPDQLASRRAGFELGRKIREQYANGTATEITTGRLLLWAILSRKAGAFPHEAGYMDLVQNGADKWIRKAAEGKWTDADTEAYARWAEKVMRGRSSPGKSVTQNIGAFGDTLLPKLAEKVEDGRTKLKVLHDMMADQSVSTSEVRRAFFTLLDKPGIGNKVLSFAMLVTGRIDTVVLDRVQFSHFWGGTYQERAAEAGLKRDLSGRVNIYDNPQGGIQKAGDGHFGLAIYEALARGLEESVREGYRLAGMDGFGDGTLGAFHWDSWLIESSQAIGHPTIEAVPESVTPRPDLAVRQGKFDTFAYNFEYRADGLYQVPLLSGDGYVILSPEAVSEFQNGMKKTGVVPQDFKVSRHTSEPWVDAPEVDRERYDQELLRLGRRADAQDVAPAATDAERRAASDAADQAPVGRRGERDLRGVPRSRKDRAAPERILGAKVLGRLGAHAYEISSSAQGRKAFAAALGAIRSSNRYFASVTFKSADELKGARLFVSASGNAGFAVSADREVTAAWSNSAAEPGEAVRVMESVIQESPPGHLWMTSFATKLPELYAQLGARPVSRMSFNPEYAPEGWDYDLYRRWQDGKPDVVFYVVDGTAPPWSDEVRESLPLIEDYDQAEAVAKDAGLEMQQAELAAEGPRGPRGSYQRVVKNGKVVRLIRLFDSRNESTFVHEWAHYLLDLRIDLLRDNPDNPILLRDVRQFLEWAGVEGAAEMDAEQLLAAWDGMSDQEHELAHETFSYSFEIYVSENVAPSPQLKRAFSRIAAAMRLIARQLYGGDDAAAAARARFQQVFGIELPPMSAEVRSVMDRMLSAEVAVRSHEHQFEPLFRNPEELSKDPEEWENYKEQVQAVEDEAIDEFSSALIGEDGEMLGKLRKRMETDLDREAKRVRRAIYKEEEERAREMPVHRLRRFIQTGELEGGQFKGNPKLNTDQLRAAVPGVRVSELGAVTSPEGSDPKAIAAIFGYDSVTEMVDDLRAHRSIEADAQRATSQRMNEEFSSIATPEAREMAVTAAVVGAARRRIAATEMEAVMPNSSQDAAEVTAAARGFVESTALSDIQPRVYSLKARRARQRAVKALRKNDRGEAARMLRSELLYNEMARIGATTLREADGIVRRLQQRVRSGNDKQRSRYIDNRYVYLARELLRMVGLGDARNDQFRLIRDYDPSFWEKNVEPTMSMLSRLKDKVGLGSYRALTPQELDQVATLVRITLDRGRAQKMVQTANAVEDRDLLAGELLQVLRQNTRHYQDEIGTGSTVDEAQRRRWERQEKSANWLRAEHAAMLLDGGERGVFTRTFYETARQADDESWERTRELRERLREKIRAMNEAIGKNPPREIRATKEVDGFDYTFTGKGEQTAIHEIATVIANLGTRSNLNRVILGGRGPDTAWGAKTEDGDADPSNVFRFLQRLVNEGILKREVFDVVQEIQDVFEETKPKFQEATMHISGVYVKELEARPYSMRFGDEVVQFRGGYVPAVYDADISGRSARTGDVNLENGGDAALNLTHPATNERISGYRDVVDLNFARLANAFRSAVRYSYVAPVIHDLQKLLVATPLSKALQDNARQFWGTRNSILRVMFERILSDRVAPNDRGEKNWKWLDQFRARFGAWIFSLDLVNASQNLTQLHQAAWADLGAKWTFHGIARSRDASEAQKSVFMRRRMDPRAQQVMVDLDDSKLSEMEEKVGYLLPRITQQWVDLAIWNGAYGKWLAELRPQGMSDEKALREAQLYADHMVRIHGGSADKIDAAGYEQHGHSLIKLLTQFMNFSNYTRNHRATVWKKFERETGGYRYGALFLNLLTQSWVTAGLAAAVGYLWREGVPEDEEDLRDFVMDTLFGGVGFIAGSAIAPPIGGVVAAFGTSAAAEMIAPDQWTPQPALRAPAIDTMVQMATTAKRAVQGDVRARDAKTLAEAINAFTGIPVGALARQIGYASQLAAGEVRPTGTGDLVRGLVTGRASQDSRVR